MQKRTKKIKSNQNSQIEIFRQSFSYNAIGKLDRKKRSKIPAKEKDKEQEQLYKQIGKLTAQLEWAKKNLKSMNLNIKKEPVKDDVAELI